ncbi:hypothetical protein IAT38_007701 [Cryptococcus sp. DSM 104549]
MPRSYDDKDSGETHRRALEAHELKIAWKEQPHNPGAKTGLEVPSTYPVTRLNYELTAPGDVLVQQKLRLFQKQYLDYLFSLTGKPDLPLNLDDDVSNDDVEEEKFVPGEDSYERWDWIAARLDSAESFREEVLESLEDKLHYAAKLKRLGDQDQCAIAQLPTWAKAWGELRPFYPEALALDDPERAWLCNLYATLWTRLAKAATVNDNVMMPHPMLMKIRARKIIAEYRCAWAAWDNREYAPAPVVQEACAMAAKWLLLIYRGEEHRNAHRKALWKYFNKQEKVLRDVPESELFGDLAPELRIALPAREALDEFGPAGWDNCLEHCK